MSLAQVTSPKSEIVMHVLEQTLLEKGIDLSDKCHWKSVMLETFQYKQQFPFNESNWLLNKRFYDVIVTMYVKFVSSKIFPIVPINCDLFQVI